MDYHTNGAISTKDTKINASTIYIYAFPVPSASILIVVPLNPVVRALQEKILKYIRNVGALQRESAALPVP